nr:MAG TPA: hypothetical protein [Caudoviricetes sp.]
MWTIFRVFKFYCLATCTTERNASRFHILSPINLLSLLYQI